MNTKAFGTTILDVASSMARTLKPESGELSNTVAGMIKNSQGYQLESAQKALKITLEGQDIEENVIDKTIKAMKGSTSDKAIDSISDLLKEETIRPVDAILKKAKASANKNIEKADADMVLNSVGDFEKYINYPQAYFNSADKKVNQTRIGAAAGAYVGTTVGARYLSGGTLTTDSYGKKDIVGVPFL